MHEFSSPLHISLDKGLTGQDVVVRALVRIVTSIALNFSARHRMSGPDELQSLLKFELNENLFSSIGIVGNVR
jgi:hypothetical protein